MTRRRHSTLALVLLGGCAATPGTEDADAEPATASTTGTTKPTSASTLNGTAAAADSTSTTATGEGTSGDGPGPTVVCSQGEGFCLQIDPEAPHCFCPEPLVSPITWPHAVQVVDVDGDGRLDIVAGDKPSFEAPSRLRIWQGGVEEPVVLAESPVSLAHETMALGDIDEDGVLDFVGRPSEGAELPILLSNGETLPTTFEVHPIVESAYTPAVALGDVDADGHLDLIYLTNTVVTVFDLSVCLGQGDGTFGEPVVRQLGRGIFTPMTLAIVDLDEDGTDDVVALADQWMRGVADGGGILADATHLEPASLANFADANADGHLDAFWIQLGIDHAPETVGVDVHQGEGGGVFSLLHTWSFPGEGSVSGDWGDLDGDGLLDVLFTSQVSADGASYFALGHADASGNYGALIESTALLPPRVGLVAVADLTDDGRTDILVSQRDVEGAQGTLMRYVAQP